MTIAAAIALFTSMVVLALIPGPGVLVVTARSASAGLRHGLSTTVGIVVGDFVFITLALLGLRSKEFMQTAFLEKGSLTLSPRLRLSFFLSSKHLLKEV